MSAEEETQIETIYLGQATGPTPEMEQAAPWMTGGLGLVTFAVLLYFGSSILAVKWRLPGRWFTISGLSIVMIYFIFQSTVAQDAELRYGPVAEAMSLISYGLGGLLVAVGYAKVVLQQRGQSGVR